MFWMLCSRDSASANSPDVSRETQDTVGSDVSRETEGSRGTDVSRETEAPREDPGRLLEAPLNPVLGPLANNGGPTQTMALLAGSPAIDTGPSYSPDGTQIAFESDRGGSQQIYVMNADGSNQHRISFGDGKYGTPVWSPRGDQMRDQLEQMQQQLAESQKLDALGQLTGGVAHDFNNILMIVSGSLHTLRKGIHDDPKLQRANYAFGALYLVTGRSLLLFLLHRG